MLNFIKPVRKLKTMSGRQLNFQRKTWRGITPRRGAPSKLRSPHEHP